jgi:predicted HTH domain antitoxin
MGKKVVVELPGMVKLPDEEVEKRIKVELALRLYEKGILSFGQARRLAGLSKWEFIELLAEEGSGIHYDEEELENDLKVVEEIS